MSIFRTRISENVRYILWGKEIFGRDSFHISESSHYKAAFYNIYVSESGHAKAVLYHVNNTIIIKTKIEGAGLL